MWKVKRMNSARIIVLGIAIGAGGIAADIASGSEPGLHSPSDRGNAIADFTGSIARSSFFADGPVRDAKLKPEVI
jgi:hypothetical protein